MFRRLACFILLFLSAKHVCSSDSIGLHYCIEDNKTIPIVKLCDNKGDCLHGSDESTVLCKRITYGWDLLFECANGVLINTESKCDGIHDCLDHSDESVTLCWDAFHETDQKNYTIHRRGICKDGQVQCPHSQKCINETQRCDNIIDCSNGWDESTEVCMSECNTDEFKCGNGKCIPQQDLCNNEPDCIDGSDELPVICTDSQQNPNHANWLHKEPVYCKEPIEQNLQFGNHTKYYFNLTEKFVYANMAVRFECHNPKGIISGSAWNTCNNTGQWHYPLPQCENVNNRKRRSVEFCNPDELYCLDSSKPYCRDEFNMEIECKAPNGLPPQTTAIIGCNIGFKLVNPVSVTCLANGTWENISKIKEACRLECGNEMLLSKNNPHIKLEKAKSIVFLYLYNNTTSNYDYICGGTIIRPNVIITAAHCVANHEIKDLRVIRTIRRPYINKTEGWAVERKFIAGAYDPFTMSLDLAILQLKPERNDMSYATCLPGYSYDIDEIITPTQGRIYTLATLGKEANTVGDLTKSRVKVIEAGSNYVTLEVKSSADAQFCKGDAGSGFIADCSKEGVKKDCLFGVVSTSQIGTDGPLACGSTISVSRTTQLHALDFIRKTMQLIADSCDSN